VTRRSVFSSVLVFHDRSNADILVSALFVTNTNSHFRAQVDLADTPALFCGPHRNSPKLVGDTSRRHSSIPRGNSTDKGIPLAAQENVNTLNLPENSYCCTPDRCYGSGLLVEDSGSTPDLSNSAAEVTTPMLGPRDDEYEKLPVPLFPFLGPRRRVRDSNQHSNSLDVIPNNKQIERVCTTDVKRSCHSLQVTSDKLDY